jgi:hypothetical protein
METKDQLIHDLYISCKSFIDFYQNIFIPKLEAEKIDQIKIKNLNNQLGYNFDLLLVALKKGFLRRLFLKKAKRDSKTYEEIHQNFGLLIDLTVHPNIQYKNPAGFLENYLKGKESLICMIAKKQQNHLDAYIVSHQLYGWMTLRELVYLIISLNYGYIGICKRAMVYRMDKAV